MVNMPAAPKDYGKDRILDALEEEETANSASRRAAYDAMAGSNLSSKSGRNAFSSMVSAAAAGASAATGAAKSGGSVVVKGLDFLKPKVPVPTFVLVFVALYQLLELFLGYIIPLQTRAFVYFTIFVAVAFVFKILPVQHASALSLISLLAPVLWSKLLPVIPKSSEFGVFTVLNALMLFFATCWTWVLVARESDSFVGGIARDIIIILLLYGIVWPVLADAMKTTGFGESIYEVDQKYGIKSFFEGLKKSLDSGKAAGSLAGRYNAFIESIGDFFSGQISTATGGIVPGKEKDSKPVGVFIKKLEPAEPSYVEGRKVVVLADIKAETLEEPISIIPKCWSDFEKRDEIQGVILPPEIRVDKFEDNVFSCRFDSGLKPGSRSVKVSATFNFKTDADLRAYVIDRGKVPKDEDPVAFYKLPEKEPVAEYTQGPVMIGIDAGPVINAAPMENEEQSIKLSLSTDWQGRIDSLSELKLYVPKGLRIDVSGCTGRFVASGGDEDYDFYQLDIAGERSGNPEAFTDIRKGSYLYFLCPLEFSERESSKLLGEGGVGLRFFRVSARYTYTVEKDVVVRVDERKKPSSSSPVSVSSSSGGGSTGSASVVDAIRYWADRHGVPRRIAFQVAMVEGGLQHYAPRPYSAYGNCDGVVKCGDSGCSLGVMQINTCTNAHPQCVGKVVYQKGSPDMCIGALSCSGKDVKDLNCNIEAGLRLLKAGYDESVSSPVDACTCGGRYSGWGYALRRYNGCACSNDYVENVLRTDVSEYLSERVA
ncbi:hypothetical protein HY640_01205 [Candidatus Woesearchaeota archaeon]|nr:hypothetical protein [Candidatus Woesearchaeota archaeon]